MLPKALRVNRDFHDAMENTSYVPVSNTRTEF